MKRLPTALATAALLAGLLPFLGCWGQKGQSDIRYFRAIRREPSGHTRGVGEMTRKQAGTQQHWRFYLTDGRTERLELYDKAGELLSEVQLSYDERGRVAEERTYDPAKNLRAKLVLAYDEAGRVAGFKYYSKDAGLREERKWEYDERGRLKEIRVYGHQGIMRRMDRFVYDKKNPNKLLGVNRYNSNRELVEKIPAKNYDWQ